MTLVGKELNIFTSFADQYKKSFNSHKFKYPLSLFKVLVFTMFVFMPLDNMFVCTSNFDQIKSTCIYLSVS